jgi:hypothetical protein
MGEYMSIYWAAACLVFWAGRGGSNVTGGQLNDAINMVCDEAKLTPPQEGLLKTLIWKMLKKGAKDGAE